MVKSNRWCPLVPAYWPCRTEPAITRHRHTPAITEKALGPDHPNLAMALNNSVVLHKDAGEYAKAEEPL